MIRIYQGHCLAVLRSLPAESVNCCVTSPPYWGLRDYGADGQLGQEESLNDYIANLVEIFREIRRVLAADGTLWLNLGDCYAGSGIAGKQALDKLGDRIGTGGGKKQSSILTGRAATPEGLKPKDLIGLPWRVAFALQADGWFLRRDIIWHKLNPMPESVTDRPSGAHEYIFLLSKSGQYYYDHAAIMEDSVTNENRPAGIVRDRLLDYDSKERQLRPSKKRGEFAGKTQAMPGREAFRAVVEKRNKRSVWSIASQPYAGAHFATFPPKLIEPCIMAGSKQGGIIIDPFFGAGTTGLVADRLGRECIGIEINSAFIDLARNRLKDDGGMLIDVQVIA